MENQLKTAIEQLQRTANLFSELVSGTDKFVGNWERMGVELGTSPDAAMRIYTLLNCANTALKNAVEYMEIGG